MIDYEDAVTLYQCIVSNTRVFGIVVSSSGVITLLNSEVLYKVLTTLYRN